MLTVDDRYTVDDVLSWGPGPSYDRARLEKLWAGREALTPREISELDAPLEDVVWAICNVVPDEAISFAIDEAERACARSDHTDPRSLNAIDVARRFINGEATNEWLASARAAAADAAAAAKWAAADAAVDAASATCAAAESAHAAVDAAWEADPARAASAAARAADAAARAAAGHSSRAPERERQIAVLLTMAEQP